MVTILPIPIPTPEQLKQASDILTLIKKFFKKKDKAGSVIKAKGIPYEQLKDMNEILILEMDDSQYLVQKEHTPPLIFEYLKRQKSDLLKDKTIDLIRTDFAPQVKETKENYDGELEQIPLGLNADYSALLIMSKKIKKFFDNGDAKRGQILKSSLGEVYGSKGNLFCNLYSKGYLIKALEHFDHLVKYDAMSKENINDFLSFYINNWDSVFFVHSNIDGKGLFLKILSAFSAGKDYIAIHGIGNVNKETIDIVYNSIVSSNVVDSTKYETKINEDNIKRGEDNILIKDIYFFTEKGKTIYEGFQLKTKT